MSLVAKKRSRITGLAEVIAIITFHVHRNAAQVAALDEGSHASRDVAELIIMSYGQLEPLRMGERNESLRLRLVERERLLHVNVASLLQARPRKIVMALRRRRDVNYVWSGIAGADSSQ